MDVAGLYNGLVYDETDPDSVFFLIMTPMAILLRLLRKDILEEDFKKDAGTYWRRYEPVPDKERYKKQF